MSAQNNGGAAFPQEVHYIAPNGQTGSHGPCGGMTLRDYFAARVLPTMIVDGEALEVIKMMAKKTGKDGFELTAETCYAYADAMLAARSK